MLDLFGQLGQCVALRLNHPKLPADAKVQSVHADYSRRALCVIVESQEFPVVPAWGKIPVFDDASMCEYEARYVVGDRLTTWKPADVAITEVLSKQAKAVMRNNAIGPLYISPALKAKLEACDTIVDQSSTKVPVTRHGSVVGHADPINQIITITDLAFAAQMDMTERLADATGISAEVVNGDPQTARAAAETEAEFFKRSVLAE